MWPFDLLWGWSDGGAVAVTQTPVRIADESRSRYLLADESRPRYLVADE